MGTHALEVARIEAGFLAAQVDFHPADQAIMTDRSRSPFELDLGRLVDFKKPCFNGRRALLEEQKNGSRYRFVKLDVEGNKPARSAYIYDKDKNVVGTVDLGGMVAVGEEEHRLRDPEHALGQAGRRALCGDLLPARARSGTRSWRAAA